MASEFCLVTLLDSKEFSALDISDQRQRLTQFVATWFDLDQPLDTIDCIRMTARLRAHASKMKLSAGEAMELILPLARKQYAQDVYERSATAIWDEDRRAATPTSENHHHLQSDIGDDDLGTGNQAEDPTNVQAEPAQEPVQEPAV